MAVEPAEQPDTEAGQVEDITDAEKNARVNAHLIHVSKMFDTDMTTVNVEGTNLEGKYYPVPELEVNSCGQWVCKADTDMIAGTTGYYKPYTVLEAALLQIFKQKAYLAQSATRIPYPKCQRPGPVCQKPERPRGVITKPCYSSKRRRSSYIRKPYRKYKYAYRR